MNETQIDSSALAPGQAVDQAFEVARAAYEEAMREHGLLSSTIALISGYAASNIAALRAEDGA
ncbi:hypothetical protein [Actinomadura harenae]|uniref:Uncharacterized protein n=1 Tax=Actinomadura harenae TaxID=2483351 RepID=A0A3M2LXQ0_9ACTN|nr:hypothetical protein [Actinomadura harenae]RMI42169.1 hypothetical protein EBO15_20260 [Actinomadura harenae]